MSDSDYDSPFPEDMDARTFMLVGVLILAVGFFIWLGYEFKRRAEERAQQRARIIRLQEILRSRPPPTATTSNADNRSPRYNVAIGTVAFTYKLPVKKPSNGCGPPAAADEADSCSVCLEDFKVGDECKVLVWCSHVFHTPCIDMWLVTHKDCPLCRVSVHGGYSKDLSEIV